MGKLPFQGVTFLNCHPSPDLKCLPDALKQAYFYQIIIIISHQNSLSCSHGMYLKNINTNDQFEATYKGETKILIVYHSHSTNVNNGL